MEKLAGYAIVAGTLATGLSFLTYLLYVVSGVRTARMATAGVGTTTRVGFFSGPMVATVGQYASLFAWLGAIFLVVGLGIRAIVAGHGPFSNMYEFSVAFGVGILGTFLWVERRYHQRGLALLVLPISLAMLLYALLMVPADIQPLVPALQNNLLLTIHVAVAIVAYGSFAVSFAAALVYLAQGSFQVWWLAGLVSLAFPFIGVWAIPFTVPLALLLAKGIVMLILSVLPEARLPKLDVLDEISYRSIVLGFPFLTLTIVLGALWADQAWGRYWGWDPKETASLVTWFIYGAYLHARVMRGWRGSRAATVVAFGFGAVIMTYFGNLFFGGLHAYSGLG